MCVSPEVPRAHRFRRFGRKKHNHEQHDSISRRSTHCRHIRRLARRHLQLGYAARFGHEFHEDIQQRRGDLRHEPGRRGPTYELRGDAVGLLAVHGPSAHGCREGVIVRDLDVHRQLVPHALVHGVREVTRRLLSPESEAHLHEDEDVRVLRARLVRLGADRIDDHREPVHRLLRDDHPLRVKPRGDLRLLRDHLPHGEETARGQPSQGRALHSEQREPQLGGGGERVRAASARFREAGVAPDEYDFHAGRCSLAHRVSLHGFPADQRHLRFVLPAVRRPGRHAESDAQGLSTRAAQLRREPAGVHLVAAKVSTSRQEDLSTLLLPLQLQAVSQGERPSAQRRRLFLFQRHRFLGQKSSDNLYRTRHGSHGPVE